MLALFTGQWDAYEATAKTGNADSLAAWFTEDAILMEPEMADVVGRTAIRDFAASIFAMMTIPEIEITPREVNVYGETAYDFGTYREVVQPKDGPATTHRGRYAVVWNRQPDGAWKFARVMVNSVERPSQ